MLAFLELDNRRRVLGTAERQGARLRFCPLGKRHQQEPGQLLDRVEAIHAERATILRGVSLDGKPFRVPVTLVRFERDRTRAPELILEFAPEIEA